MRAARTTDPDETLPAGGTVREVWGMRGLALTCSVDTFSLISSIFSLSSVCANGGSQVSVAQAGGATGRAQCARAPRRAWAQA